mgnify:FL=1
MVARTKRTRRVAGEITDKTPDELPAVMNEISTRYGKHVMVAASTSIQPLRIPTGIFLLDFCLLGGIPVSRGTMLLGKKHSGKSTTACLMAANAQLMFPEQRVVVVDIEGTFDTIWAAKLGVDLDLLLLVQPESGEAACDIVDVLIRTREISMVIVDSVAALTPMKEIEGSAEDANVGLQARMMGQLLRKTTAGMIAERHRGHLVTPVYINQYRAKIGGTGPGFAGEPLMVPGGHALGFANSVEIEIRNWEKTRQVKGEDVLSHNEHTFRIQKNKLNAGMRNGAFTLIRLYDEKRGLPEGAIDDGDTMLSFAKKYGAYSGGGSSWTLRFWDEEEKYRGVDDAVSSLYNNGELYAKLRDYLIWENAKSCGMDGEFLSRFTEPYGIDNE